MDRIFKYEKYMGSALDLSNVCIPVDSPNWKRARAASILDIVKVLSLNNSGGTVTVEVDKDINVSSVDYVNQFDSPERPPDTLSVNTRAHIAIDDNYLYVWVPALKRWKRSVLTEW